MKDKQKFLIIDGSSLVYRAFFALPLLQTKQGLYTNAVYGFTTMLLKVLEDEAPDYVVVAFDKSKKTFRHEKYSAYKGRREKTPQELSEQFSYVREVLAALQIPVEEMAGFEADDLIGTLAVLGKKHQLTPVIVSGDADIFQLVDIPAEVIFTRRGITQVERYNEETLKNKYGLTAQQFIDYKGLKGDASDNIPGVPGVGEKTAQHLLAQFGTMAGVYEHLAEIKGKLRSRLEDNREQAYLSKYLATIVTDVPLNFVPAHYQRQAPQLEGLRRIFTQLEFNSLLDKLPDSESRAAEQITTEAYRQVTLNEWREFFPALAEESAVAITPLPLDAAWQETLKGLAVATSVETIFLPLTEQRDLAVVLEMLLDSSFTTLTYDSKAWINICWQLTGKEPTAPLFDAALAAYLLDPLENGYPPQKLAQHYLQRHLPQAPGKKETDTTCESNYLCAAVRTLFDLYPVLLAKLQEFDLAALYHQLELPLAAVLARMERQGVAVDQATLAALRDEFSQRIAVLQQDIFELAGEEFNLNSPKQLAVILFEKLGLPALKKTKTGYSTNAQVLEELAPHHEIVEKILQYRTLIKLLGTYLAGMAKLINPQTGRIHTTFKQTVTATGRLSSAEPNLQNIPIRLEEGRRIRRAFVPGTEGKVLLSADYSQIELRVMAHISGDQVLISSFKAGEDIHLRTASEVFDVPPEEVSKALRERAKAVNFGIIYGISDYGLSRQLGITRQEAKSYIERYFERLPGVHDYMQRIVAEAKQNGYVTTILNRRRYLPDINHRNFNKRSFAERTAMNTPIQGSAADIIKLAMLNVERQLQPWRDKARMILQVHDDLVLEVDEAILPEVVKIVRREMEEAIQLSVPLLVEVKVGHNWAEMQKI
ncbi:MAG TPA: DNA polymerase I [Oscillospiraceae bacterium]|nr:DNA polymerase I [Oscillospiraceae bacterium]